jgi:hypothetical protein
MTVSANKDGLDNDNLAPETRLSLQREVAAAPRRR